MPFDTGWQEPDLSQPPFVFAEGIAEWSKAAEHGAGLLLPVVHPALVFMVAHKAKTAGVIRDARTPGADQLRER